MLKDLYISCVKLLSHIPSALLYQTIVEEAMHLTSSDSSSIFLEKDNQLVRVYASDNNLSQVIPRKRGFAYKAFKTRKTHILDFKKVKKTHPLLAKMGFQTILIVPLCYENRSMGVLTIQFRKKILIKKALVEEMELFGTMASLSINNALLYEEIKKALERRDLFISMASHELKTPLTAINLYMDILKKHLVKKKLPDERLVETFISEVKRLSNLVSELLATNLIQSGKIEYRWEKCSLREIISRAISNFSVIHPQRKVVLKDATRKLDDAVYGDYDKLLRVIINLLSNAAKYSPKSSEIQIKLSPTEEGFSIAVIDRGIGIPKEDIAKVVEKFYRAPNSQQEGMGLGLYLVSTIVKQHNGRLDIFSALSCGTTVEINLPKS